MSEKLKEYEKKRNFEKTKEPKGGIKKTEKKLKFVVQHHIASRDHFDFRLEWKGVLLSWAVPKGPSYDNNEKRLAVHVEDHPLDYRNFEGTIPKGQYGGGTVMLWDEGYWDSEYDIEESINKGSLKFTLYGKRLKGKWALVKMDKKEDDKQENWLLIKEKDEYVNSSDSISEFFTSIRTGRTMEEIAEGETKEMKNPFTETEVQLCKLVSVIPEGDNWLFEVKYDGYRIIAYIEEDRVRLISRNGKDYSKKFQKVADSLKKLALGRAMVLDGEMVILDESGKTDFQALQNYIKKPEGKNLSYMVFDILALDGADLRKRPLIERKETLETILKNSPEYLFYSLHVKGHGKENFNAACSAGMEGIVGKDAESTYSGTRSGSWIKIKCDNRQEFVIGGYTVSDKKSSGISSVLLGVYENDKLIYTGRAGTGFKESDMNGYLEKFGTVLSKTTPFFNPPKPKGVEKFFWMEPKFVAEIKFAEWTKDNLLRQASFKGMRIDKNPKEVKRERADTIEVSLEKSVKPAKNKTMDILKEIKITNPDKVLFENPKVTKADVINYYAAVSERMLIYVENRILSIIRCPKGINNSCFFKKHPGAGSKGIVTIPISDEKETEEYFYIKDAYGLVYEAQMGTLEFHTWGSRVEELEKPDMMIFDLDPDENMDISVLRQGVKDLKSLLDELNLKSYLKTSGGKGYHVVVPFSPSVSWDVFKDFSQRIAQVMQEKWPERYTSNVRKIKRTDKIFIDYMRNGRGATCVAPYSLRAREGAKVSMPILWSELDKITPDGIGMAEALNKIQGKDPWADFFNNGQKLQ